jgi:flagellar basal body L-ring protein FlgH
VAQATIKRLRDLIRSLNYAVSIHAAEELEDDNLTILDFENIVLTGAIVERQRDRQTREVKYIVRGNTLSSVLTEAVVKIAPDGNLFVITVYPV